MNRRGVKAVISLRTVDCAVCGRRRHRDEVAGTWRGQERICLRCIEADNERRLTVVAAAEVAA